jgi:hypothetical protein
MHLIEQSINLYNPIKKSPLTYKIWIDQKIHSATHASHFKINPLKPAIFVSFLGVATHLNLARNLRKQRSISMINYRIAIQSKCN